MSSQAELLRSATLLRHALEPGLPRSESGAPSAEGACLHAAVLLASTLNRFATAFAKIRGGDGDGDGGFQDISGKWRGHYWVEATVAGETFVVDITSDQFSGDAVVVEPVALACLRYRPGTQEVVDEAVLELGAIFGVEDLLGLPGRPGPEAHMAR